MPWTGPRPLCLRLAPIRAGGSHFRLARGFQPPGHWAVPVRPSPRSPQLVPLPALPPELRFYFYLCFGLFGGWRSPRLQLKSVYHIDFLWSKPRAGRWSHTGWSQGEALGGDRVEALVTLAALRGAPHEQARAGAVKPPPPPMLRLACTLALFCVARRPLAFQGSVPKAFGAVFA